MRHIKDVLRLRFHAGLSIREIQASTRLSVGAIQKLLKEAERLEIGWPLPADVDDAELERRLYPSRMPAALRRFEQPDWVIVHQELKRKGMTKQLLWEEYREANPRRCYSYSQYCERYRQWSESSGVPFVRHTESVRKSSLIMPDRRFPSWTIAPVRSCSKLQCS